MKVIIVGGGIAGLSCGCYLQMSGYQTEILETNPVAGGLCVSWDRGPYVFDGCLRWLVGTNPSSHFNKIWRDLDAFSEKAVLEDSEFLRVEGINGEILSFSSDLEQLHRDLKSLAPEDGALIDGLVKAARCCAALEPPGRPLELMSGLEKTKLLAKYLPVLWTVGRWKNVRLGDYLAEYRSSFLREALMALAGDERMSALVLVMVLGFRARRNAGYVLGGSRAFTEAIANRYTQLGGLLRLNTEVKSVMVDCDRATGVTCADGRIMPASTVVSCADGRRTIFEWLGGRYTSKHIRKSYEQFEVFPGVFQAFLGVNQAFAPSPRTLSLALLQPLDVDPHTHLNRIEIAISGIESGLCPRGKSILTVRFGGDFDYWVTLRRNKQGEYVRAKQKLLQEIIHVLEQRFPGVAHHIENTDLATPATIERFSGNWKGSIQGWLPTPQILGRRFSMTLPGLENFYMAGHWVQPGGGLPTAALSGKYVAQLICSRDKKEFAGTTA